MEKSKVENLKVLVVDDCASMRFTIASFLKRSKNYKCTVVEAKDGDEALKKVRASSDDFDLIVVDWHMPKMSGIEFTLKVRQGGCSQKTSIIMLTAKGGREEVIEAMSAGATDYIVKPLARKVLESKLQKHIGPRETK